MLKNKFIKIGIWILFVAYVILILKLTVFRENSKTQDVNLYPAVVLVNIYRKYGISYFSYLFLGNIGWFMPFGFVLPLIVKNMSAKKIVLLTLLFSLVIEISQYVLMVGYTEIDDVILNTLGGLLGYLCLVKRKVVIPKRSYYRI